jgi:tRNA U54 and U55 pseudouridine synthase Pus10
VNSKKKRKGKNYRALLFSKKDLNKKEKTSIKTGNLINQKLTNRIWGRERERERERERDYNL